jgi:Ca2+-binding RTX toxin-like protein
MLMLGYPNGGGHSVDRRSFLGQLGWPKTLLLLAAFACAVAAMVFAGPPGRSTPAAHAAVGPAGNGFTVTAGDLAFILKQIKIAERHSATLTPANPCGTLVGPGPDQIPDPLTAYGLRTVDGSCNNLFPGREKFAAADVAFPRLTTPNFRDAEPITPSFPVGPPGPTSYKQKLAGNVVIDSQPRVISNLVVDQTATNPAAIAAAGFPVRAQGAGPPEVFPCTTEPTTPGGTDGIPAGCTPAHHTLFIPNVTTDVGLSPPYNSLFTFFGQFFDHGVDQTVKSGGTVFVPLQPDDPLITLGPDGVPNSGDEVQPQNAFMVLTRAQNQPGTDGILGTADDTQDANNTDSPWVDQSQTYTSHSSHQVFLREYVLNAAGRPVATGKLLSGTRTSTSDGGIGTWAAVKLQAATKLGLLLQDKDVTNIPMIAADPYGKFIPGPARGLPQYVTATGLVEGNIAAPVAVPANVLHFDTPFLTDIAHNADPSPVDTNNDGIPDTTPTPDLDNTTSANFATQPVGTYDDEMLNAHFACGDGRCNENIALSTIHQIFHSEHDRLVDYIKNVLLTDTSPTGAAALPQWQLPTAQNPAGWNGERLFQAARFVTEMEYQHLVFEEFARKVQPAVRPFHVYSPDINPAIEAEFAHAVYRFGHSMLDDVVARTNGDGSDNSTTLLHAFLNPPELFNAGGTCDVIDGTSCNGSPLLTAEQGAGSVVMGSSDQVANELDEFVTETLRNNLLGLPLDLPTINMTRARSEGIPPLNSVRRQIYAETNDGQLAPYTSWADFGQHLKHPESLINFVAAYGQHPSITSETTLAGKRAAAKLIVDPALGDTPPPDAQYFMFSAPAPGGTNWATTPTGLEDVDLWVGGLAEVTNLFGGLLGSTFNYVFQTQLEKLQDGDRLYYLARTPGMNLRTQLEGNSFSELIQRNTDNTNTLKADAFATADCKFQLGNLSGTAAGFASFGSIVADDPSTTDCNESQLLFRQPDGTIQYKARNVVDPPGINGQAVYQGTNAVDRVTGGNDNDTFWGGLGNDRIEGNGGDDVALGGEGNDIITDLDGADVPKGGPGNDAIDGGPGDDIPMGNDGIDFINGGANDNESFAGEGNDFIIAGQGADAVFGDGGDDWIEGGSGQDLLQGDHGAPFFDDPAESAPGNDIFIGQVGENDYDTEGGDDVMSQNAAVDRNAGAGGFDWAFHQYDTVGADDDMEINNNLVGVPIQVVVNRDRWQETEADSGSKFNDVIRGTEVAPNTLGGAGFTGCDALDAAGVARIAGLGTLVTTFPSPLAPIVAASASGFCPLTGPNVWAEGDILLGGGGSDSILGRGADDIIDGDRSLNVRISVRAGVDANGSPSGAEIGSTDLMENKATSGNFGAGTAGMTLQQAVFAGLVNPGQLQAVREITTTGVNATDVDTAVFRNTRASYTLQLNATNVVVTDTTGLDGVDTLYNIERLQFSDQTVSIAPVARLSAASLSFGNQTVGTNSATQTIVVTNTGLRPLVISAGGITASAQFAAVASLITPCSLTAATTVNPGASCRVGVQFRPTAAGSATGTLSIVSNAPTATVALTGTGVAAAALPGLPSNVTVVANVGRTFTVSWAAATTGTPFLRYEVRQVGILGNQVSLVSTANGTTLTVLVPASALVIAGLPYRFQVRAVNAAGPGPFTALTAGVNARA